MKRKHSSTIQCHHITYNPPRTVFVFKGEHMILTYIQWRKKFSKGFLEALKDVIVRNEKSAFHLSAPERTKQTKLKRKFQ